MGILRLLLALSVLLQHIRGCRYAMTGGATSVQAFFIISGFLIAMILDVKYNKPGQLWLFYSNRALRIYSTYWAVLIAAVLVHLAAHEIAHQSVFDLWIHNSARLGSFGRWYLALTNVFIVGQDLALFMTLGQHGFHLSAAFWKSSPLIPSLMVIPPAWSLSLELMFYALAPWILRWRTRWIVALMSLSIALRGTLWFSGLRADPWSYRFFPNELSLFLAGALAYRIIYRNPRLAELPPVLKMFALGVIPVVVFYPLYDHSKGLFFSTTKILFLVYFVAAIPLLFRMTARSSLDRRLGELSYPLYLCHFSIVQVLNHFSTRLNIWLRVSIAIVVSCSVAYVCVLALERPLDRFRQSRLKGPAGRRTEAVRVSEERQTNVPLPLSTEMLPNELAIEPQPGNGPV